MLENYIWRTIYLYITNPYENPTPRSKGLHAIRCRLATARCHPAASRAWSSRTRPRRAGRWENTRRPRSLALRSGRSPPELDGFFEGNSQENMINMDENWGYPYMT